MPDPSYPQVNGNRYSWASVVININGKKFKGVKAFNYKNTLEPGEVRGTGPQLLGRTRGDLKPEAGFEMYKAEYDALIAFMGEGYMEQEFTITASFSDRNQPITTVEVTGARIADDDESHTQGTEALVVKVKLSVMAVIKNGIKPIYGMQGVG